MSRRIRGIRQARELIEYCGIHDAGMKDALQISGYTSSAMKNFVYKLRHAPYDPVTGNDEEAIFLEEYDRFVLRNRRRHSRATTLKQYPEDPLNTGLSQTKIREEKDGKELIIEWKAGSNYPEGHIKTLDELLAACKVDLKVWKVKDFQVNKWDVSMGKKSTGGPIKTIENFQVKARLERRTAEITSQSALDTFIKQVKNYKAPVHIVHPQLFEREEHNLLEVNIFDLHIGKLAWAGEVGENYDTKIARRRFLDSLDALLNRAIGFDYDRILFPIGNDFFNSDNKENTTSNGTPQEEDLRWQKTFDAGVALIVDGINRLKEQSRVPIDVVVIPGNHDLERSYYLGAYLSAWFKDDKMVTIDNGASPRKYYQFGKVLIGLTHGKEEKEASLPMLMAGEAKKAWAETDFHEWHLGHFHKKSQTNYTVLDKTRVLNEDLFVTVRYLSSLSGTEEWHHKKGFVGNTKAAEAFIWNDEVGMIGHLNTNFVDFDVEH